MNALHRLSADATAPFPDPARALREPDGLLAVGGCLSVTRLKAAYRRGVFPWYGEGEPILWWTPDPRAVLFPEALHLARSLRKTLRKPPERGGFRVTLDTAFAAVTGACAEPRPGQDGTWITPEMERAYVRLHREGVAHSVEAWRGEELVGGLYGVAIGRVFFGESMFTRVQDASKVAFAHLVAQLRAWDYRLIDCQMHTAHLASLGARDIPRATFNDLLDRYCILPGRDGPWRLDLETRPWDAPAP